MSLFCDAFDQHVLPEIARRIRVNAFVFALEAQNFTSAANDVLAFSYRRGATFLTDEEQWALEDRIVAALLSEIDRAETDPVSYGRELDAGRT